MFFHPLMMQTFTREERLRSKKIIERLFAEGKNFNVPPFFIIWIPDEYVSFSPARILISVSKRKIRKAVDRNLLKRRIREAYRGNKNLLYEFLIKHNRKCSFAVVYSSGKIAEYKEIEEKIILVLQRLQKEYAKDLE